MLRGVQRREYQVLILWLLLSGTVLLELRRCAITIATQEVKVIILRELYLEGWLLLLGERLILLLIEISVVHHSRLLLLIIAVHIRLEVNSHQWITIVDVNVIR